MRVPLLLASIVGLCLLPTMPAVAGMPMVLPEDLPTLMQMNSTPQARIQAISFFVGGLLLSSFAVQYLWNYLAGDFQRLPQLTYFKALAMVVLWGLLFLVVLTMISGARELLTPGAWNKDGLTYTLDENDSAPSSAGAYWQPTPWKRQSAGNSETGP